MGLSDLDLIKERERRNRDVRILSGNRELEQF